MKILFLTAFFLLFIPVLPMSAQESPPPAAAGQVSTPFSTSPTMAKDTFAPAPQTASPGAGSSLSTPYVAPGASSAKRALIAELLQVTDAKKLVSDMPEKLLKQISFDYPRLMTEALNKDGLKVDPDNEEKYQTQILSSLDLFSKRFKEQLPQTVNIGEVLEQVSYDLYDKFFTEPELKELIQFYKTATGKKSFQIMPQAMVESMQKSGEALNPKINSLISKLFEEEKGRLKGMYKLK